MIIFNGAKFVEQLIPQAEKVKVSADVALFVASWETRAVNTVNRVEFECPKAILISFEDDGLDDDEIKFSLSLLSKKFATVIHRRIPASTSRKAWSGQLENLIMELPEGGEATTIAVDYTCLPKAISQTLFRAFIRKGSFAKSIWMYSLGKYDEGIGNLFASQGVREFFPIRHTPGDGGLSPNRVAVVGLGNDESLVIEFLERFNFDRVVVLSANSENSPGLRTGADRLKDRLIKEGRVHEEDFFECDASSVISAINTLYKIVASQEPKMSVDIFLSGPKSHAIAACVVVEKFSETVRLMGREAEQYQRNEVPAEGTISIVEVIDYTNPSVPSVLKGFCST